MTGAARLAKRKEFVEMGYSNQDKSVTMEISMTMITATLPVTQSGQNGVEMGVYKMESNATMATLKMAMVVIVNVKSKVCLVSLSLRL